MVENIIDMDTQEVQDHDNVLMNNQKYICNTKKIYNIKIGPMNINELGNNINSRYMEVIINDTTCDVVIESDIDKNVYNKSTNNSYD